MLSTTGGKLKVSPKKILERYSKIKNQNKSKNVVIGFGITEKTIKSLKKADGLVVGSAICKEISDSINKTTKHPTLDLGFYFLPFIFCLNFSMCLLLYQDLMTLNPFFVPIAT